MNLSHALPRPINRVGFLLLVAGLTLVVWGLLERSDPGDYLSDLWRALDGTRLSRRYLWPIRWGVLLSAAGLLLSFAYPFTIGPLLRWIRYGSSHA